MTFEGIMQAFARGEASLPETCTRLRTASSANPVGTRFWGQRIEAILKIEKITKVQARALLDALETPDSDRTMWIDPTTVDAKSAALPRPTTLPAANADTISSPEDLRARLFAPRARGAVETKAPASASLPTVSESSPPLPVRVSATYVEPIPLGTVIKDRYQIVEQLGSGGIGQVFRALDLADRKEPVTLKVIAVNLKYEPYAFGALSTAVRTAQHLEHENIARIYDIDAYDDRVFITMEPLRGRWLSALIREVRNTGMTFEEAWPIVTGIANGLAYAHKMGVVHSDLSPHAVFVREDGTPKIMGFGLVQAVPASNEAMDVLDTLTMRAYTEAYTADAWLQQGRPHPADDLYPLGVIAYEMLTGVHPFSRCTLTVARQRGLTFPPIEGLERRARKLIERCLSFDRETRPKDADMFVKGTRPGWISRLRAASP